MTESSSNALDLRKVAPVAGLLGILGAAATLIGAFTTSYGWQSYLFGFIFIAGLTIGCLALTLVHHTIRATWSLSILRLIEAASSPASIIVLALLFIPIAIKLPELYHWADPSVMANDHVLQNKAWFLNSGGFVGRSMIYFVAWIALSYFFGSSSRKQDQTKDPMMAQRRANFSSPGLPFFVILTTLTLTDWVMSLEPHWFSTVYPLLSMVGFAAAVVSLGTIVIMSNVGRAPYNEIAARGYSQGLSKDLGNILFMLTMVWAYLTLSQFLIIWSGNLPEEVPYYVVRSHGGWQWLGQVLIIGRFFLPFLALLAPKTKAYARNLIRVAIWILVMHILDVFWVVVPSFGRGGILDSIKWTDLTALIGMVGIWLGVFGTQVGKAALIPEHDGRLKEQLEHA